jgi:hypothetical protein
VSDAGAGGFVVTWLTEHPAEPAGERLRALLGGPTIAAPGVFNGLTALLAAEGCVVGLP